MKALAAALSAILFSVAIGSAASAGPAEDDAAIADCLDAGGAAASVCFGVISEPCLALPDRQTTVGMSSCMRQEGEAWDRLLNAEYQRLIDALDAEQVAALRKAQRAWIDHRDSSCGFYHVLIRGTLSQILGAGCWAEATAMRVGDLRDYLSLVGE